MDAEKTGNRVFFINQEGDIAACHNRNQRYEGMNTANTPDFGAAYSDTILPTMEEAVAFAIMGLTANGGNIWTQVGN